jgi:hypothetical protein
MYIMVPRLTVTLESLSVEAVQEGAAVAAECETFVVVDFEPVGHVDAEPSLQGQLLLGEEGEEEEREEGGGGKVQCT